ncbi:MAG: Rap1a/Tai family immunity protein [Pyrinomonadaceae bacterium]|uniref:Rap1a/Tai family immunity protein n=1 Tax=Pseudomonas sp. TaxID=306 RepID=UPI003D6FE962
MKVLLMVVAMVGMLGSGAAMAADVKLDGNQLLVECQHYIKLVDGGTVKTDVLFEAGMCGGFVQGVANTVFFYSDELKKNERFCIPGTVKNSQLVRVVVKYLKDNPKTLNEERMSLVWLSFMDAYPCK